MPNLRQLEYLVAIADTHNFRRAAERTNATQPTLSEQLKALETRLGVKLVERTRSQVMITPIGNQVVSIARRMLADAEEIRTLAASGGKELSGVLRLGLPPTVGPYLLPLMIPKLREHYPELKLYVREELPSELVPALSDGRHDLILCLMPSSGTNVVSKPLFREPLKVAVATGHPLAARQQIKRSDLSGEDVLALGQGHQLHDVVVALCDVFGAQLRFDYEGTSLDTLREMVAMGLGITFLPGLYVEAVAGHDKSIAIRDLADRQLYRTVGMAWRQSSERQNEYSDLAELLRSLITKAFPDFAVVSD
ncbi:MAG: LysR substrate-binding domain-containing protein [Pseudomonadota bacterium]